MQCNADVCNDSREVVLTLAIRLKFTLVSQQCKPLRDITTTIQVTTPDCYKSAWQIRHGTF